MTGVRTEFKEFVYVYKRYLSQKNFTSCLSIYDLSFNSAQYSLEYHVINFACTEQVGALSEATDSIEIQFVLLVHVNRQVSPNRFFFVSFKFLNNVYFSNYHDTIIIWDRSNSKLQTI